MTSPAIVLSHALEGALAAASETQQVVIGTDVLRRTPEVVRSCLDEGPVVVVADTVTFELAGRRVQSVLVDADVAVIEPLVLPGCPSLRASAENVDIVLHHLSATGACAVAVGSGTLNDLVKRASHLVNRPYAVVATAPSMDGYTAFAAPITVDGFKTSLPCPAPRAVVADLDILAAAPAHMTASGYGDLLGKVPAGACWLVADAAGAEAIDPQVWPYLQDPFRVALSRPEALRAGDPAAFRDLIEGLVLSGLTIQMYGSSRPGSGMEHLMSHLWEMQGLGVNCEPPLSHGMKVGLGSVAAAALYEEILKQDFTELDVPGLLATWPGRDQVEAQVRQLLPFPAIVDTAVEQTLAKHLDVREAEKRLNRLQEMWPRLRDSLRAQMLGPAEVQRRLHAVGGPAHPRDIGLSMAEFRLSYERAQTIRTRYTILDFAVETRTLRPALDRLFAPDGFWGAQADDTVELSR